MSWLRLKKQYWQSDDGAAPSRYIVKASGAFPNVAQQGWRVTWENGEPVLVELVAEKPTRELAMAACDAHRAENP